MLGLTAWRSRRFEERLVWIFGSPRSGSTWLLSLLAEHRAVVPVNEPLIGLYLGPFLSDWPGIDASDLNSTNFTLNRLARDTKVHFFADEFRDVWGPHLARLICARFSAHARRYGRGSSLVVIQEPNGSQAADVIMGVLPRARLLFLLRDGRDVVDSELFGTVQGGWMSRRFSVVRGIAPSERLAFITHSAHKWLWRTEAVQAAFAAHPGPKRLVRYEDLCATPEEQMREVFDWLELPVSEFDLSALVQQHAFERVPEHQRGSREFHRSATPGLWRENLSREEQAAAEKIMGPKLRQLGYM